MKSEVKPNWKTRLAVGLMALAVPVTLVAYTYDDTFDAYSYSMVGSANTVGSYTYSMAIGMGNYLDAINNSLAVGSYLVTSQSSNSLTVGTYNVDRSGARFVVGNGTYSGGVVARNAFEVYADGSVIVPLFDNSGNAFEVHPNGDVVIPKPQGDVLMGDFTTTP